MSQLPQELGISAQPTDTTCGPTCLHAIYRYYNDVISLNEVIDETESLEEGGTLAVVLANHALARNYQAHIYTYNVQMFDPTWFDGQTSIPNKLREQARLKPDPKLQKATEHYLSYLEKGGKLSFEDLTPKLIRKHLKRGLPILTGLSATYLYQSQRIIPIIEKDDDVQGTPEGHFVILSGYEKEEKLVWVTDPYRNNPFSKRHQYQVPLERLICSILLGVLTYDANLLIIQPSK